MALKKFELTYLGKSLADEGKAITRKGVRYPLSTITDAQAEKLTEGQKENPYVVRKPPVENKK